ncbi:MAG: hypothetical protein GY861_03505, partial [bacterium]|nr:hypothetical protein [bacterium]
DKAAKKIQKQFTVEVTKKLEEGSEEEPTKVKEIKDNKGFGKELRNLLSATFTVEVATLTMEEVNKASLNPGEIRAMAPFITDADEELKTINIESLLGPDPDEEE